VKPLYFLFLFPYFLIFELLFPLQLLILRMKPGFKVVIDEVMLFKRFITTLPHG